MNRDLALGLSGRDFRFQRDHHVLELGEVLGHRLVELKAPLLLEHHGRDRGHRLGHRVDAEERPLGHRRAGLQVLDAHRFEVGDLPASGDASHRARDLSIRHELFQ